MTKIDKTYTSFGSFQIPTLKKGNTTLYVIGVQSYSKFLGPTFVEEFLSKFSIDSIVLGIPRDLSSELDEVEENAVKKISNLSSKDIRSQVFNSVYKPVKDLRTAIYRYFELSREVSLTQAGQRTKRDHLRAAHRFGKYHKIPVIHGLRPQQVSLNRLSKESFSTLEIVDMCIRTVLHQPILFNNYNSVQKVMIDEEASFLSSQVFQQVQNYQNDTNNKEHSIVIIAPREMMPKLLEYLEDPESNYDTDSLLETESVDWIQVLLLYLTVMIAFISGLRALYKAMRYSSENYTGEVSKHWSWTNGTVVKPLQFNPSLSSLPNEKDKLPEWIDYSFAYQYLPKDSDLPFTGTQLQVDGHRIWRSVLENRDQIRELQRMEREYTKGKQLRVYYHPSNHNRSLIKPGVQNDHLSNLRRQATRAGATSVAAATAAKFIF